MQSRFNNYASSILSTEEHIQFTADVVRELNNRHSGEPFFSGYLPLIDSTLVQLTDLSQRTFKVEYTGELKSSDRLRGRLYRSARSRLKDDINLAAVDPVGAGYAETVLAVFNEYPVDTEGGYTNESVGLRALFQALDTIPEAVQNSSASARIAALRVEQAQFDEWRKKQVEAQADALRGSIEPVEKQLSFQMKTVLGYLEAQATMAGNEFEETAVVVEELITKIMTPARARQTREGNLPEVSEEDL